MTKSWVEGHMQESLKDHVLELVLAQAPFQAWRMKKPDGGRLMSTLVLFTPEGIVLMGDLVPETHGSISSGGYGPDWFGGELSEAYLCQKFLKQGWHPDLAQQELRGYAADLLEGKMDSEQAALRDLSHRVSELGGNIQDAEKEFSEEVEKSARTATKILSLQRELEEAVQKMTQLRKELAEELRALADTVGDDTSVGQFMKEFCEILDLSDVADRSVGWGYSPGEAGWLCAIQQRFAELYAKMQGYKEPKP